MLFDDAFTFDNMTLAFGNTGWVRWIIRVAEVRGGLMGDFWFMTQGIATFHTVCDTVRFLHWVFEFLSHMLANEKIKQS